MADQKKALTPEEKAKIFDAALKDVNKKYGKMTALPAAGSIDVETISTGSWSIDSILGGGFPKGRFIEIYGHEASGKTSIALNAIADVQRKGGTAVYMDVENALDPRYARSLGVDTDKLIVSRPEDGEQTEMIMEDFINSGAVDIIVLDSVGAMISRKELDGDITKDTMALRVRLMGKVCSRLVHPAAVTGTCVILINQIRMKVGVMYGNPEETMGGQAIKYAASQIIQVRKGKQELDPKTGLIVRTPLTVKVMKNKIAPPLLSCTTFLKDGVGIDRDNELFDLCEKFGIIKRSGSYYKDAETGDVLGQGKPQVLEKINENVDGIKEKYTTRMLAHLSDIGSADIHDIIKDAINRGDEGVATALKNEIIHKKGKNAPDDDDIEFSDE